MLGFERTSSIHATKACEHSSCHALAFVATWRIKTGKKRPSLHRKDVGRSTALARSRMDDFSGPSPMSWVAYFIAAIASGVGIGATGIGGVLLVPLLLLIDVPIGVASPAVIASLILAGAVATTSNWRIIPKKEAATVGAATVPGALGGSLIFPLVPPMVISCFIAFVAFGSGVRAVSAALRVMYRRGSAPRDGGMASCAGTETCTASPAAAAVEQMTGGGGGEMVAAAASEPSPQSPPPSPPPPPPLPPASLHVAFALPTSHAIGLGLAVGVFSVLTSTGGPFIAIPLFFHSHPHLPPALVVALSQALCVPISGCTIAVFGLLRGSLHLTLSLAIGACVAAGVPVGARLGRRTRPEVLRLAIGAVLVATGAATAAKLAVRALGGAAEVAAR